MSIKYIVDDDPYIAIAPDGTEVGRGYKKDKRYVEILEHAKATGDYGEYRIKQPEVKVGLIAATDVIVPPNNAPEWTSAPSPSWTELVGGTYDLKQNCFDAEGDVLNFALNGGSAALPTGVSLSGAGILTATTAVTEATTAGIIVDVDDSEYTVASSSFSIVVAAAANAVLANCANVGVSDGTGYTITGTTHNITSSDSIADVNALSLSPGDGVLFQAGTEWNINSQDNRLICRAGVTYGRYDAGVNPIIKATSVSDWTDKWRGIINIAQDDVVFDGINVKESAGEQFGIYVTAGDSVKISRLVVSNLSGCGILLQNTTNSIIEYCEGAYTTLKTEGGTPGDGAHENFTIRNSDGFIVRYCYTHDTGKGGIACKSNATNGQIYGCEVSRVKSDPGIYLATWTDGIVVHDCWLHDTLWTYGTETGGGRTLMHIGVEGFADPTNQYTRNHEIYNCVIEDTQGYCLQMTVKSQTDSAGPGVTNPDPNIVSGIHFHHNTLYNNNNAGTPNWHHAIISNDDRVDFVTADWSNIVFEDNIIWETGPSDGMRWGDSTETNMIIRNNLFETGETGGSDLGTNVIYTSTSPLTDAAGGDFTPIGAALGAGHDGSDVGAAISWTCGL